MKTRVITVAALTLLLTVAAFAQNAPQAPAPPRGPGQILGPAAIAKFLDLSAAQIEQVKALQTKLGETLKPLHEAQKANAEAVKAAVEANDALKAGQGLIAGKAIGDKIKAALDAHKTAFEALLTAAQKAKWDVYQEIVKLHAAPMRGPGAGAPPAGAPLPPMPMR